MDFAAALAQLEKTAENASRADGDRKRHRSHDDAHNRRIRGNQRPRNRDPFEGLKRGGYHVLPPYRTPPPPPPDKKKHIALLAITIDDLVYEDVWREWVSSDSSVTVSLLCHAKFPSNVKSEWLRNHLIVETPSKGRGSSWADPVVKSYKPNWGSVEITRAMIDLMCDGMMIGNNNAEWEAVPCLSSKRFVVGEEASEHVSVVDKFVFVSETCLPVTSLGTFVSQVFNNDEGHDVSWVNARNLDTEGTPRNAYEGDQFRMIHPIVPDKCRWKADQWQIISRPHAHAILSLDRFHRTDDQLWTLFDRVNASDEMYFPTALGIIGALNGSDTPSIKKQAATYTDWTQGMKNPASFDAKELNKIAKLARQKGCLIARKFTGQIDVDDWKAMVADDEPDNDKEIATT